MSTRPGVSEGKLEFLEEWLKKDPRVRLEEVNQAWQAEGRTGTISQSYLSKVRAKHGLTRSKGPKEAASRRARSPRGRARPEGSREAGTLVSRASPADARDRALEGLEAEIDRLVFEVMALGGLDEVELALRKARRGVAREIRE